MEAMNLAFRTAVGGILLHPGNGNELWMWSIYVVPAESTRRAQDTPSHIYLTHFTITESRQFYTCLLILSSVN